MRAPRLGEVKTRLAVELGDALALALYRRMVEATLQQVAALPYDVTIWFTPHDAEVEVRRWLGSRWSFRPQVDGDLGARLAAAAAAAPDGSSWIAIGTDCPGLRATHVHAAAVIAALGAVALGPAADGGYYLIGGRAPLPDLFSSMPWSTSGVLPRTRQLLTRAGVPFEELPMLRDVDTAADARAEGLIA